jgi:hypothetical protein
MCFKWLNAIIQSKGAVYDSIHLYVNSYRPREESRNTVTMLHQKDNVHWGKLLGLTGT